LDELADAMRLLTQIKVRAESAGYGRVGINERNLS
jgi:hypothetical protein